METEEKFVHKLRDIALEMTHGETVASIYQYEVDSKELDIIDIEKDIAAALERIAEVGLNPSTRENMSENVIDRLTFVSYPHELIAAMIVEKHQLIKNSPPAVLRTLLDIALESEISRYEVMMTDIEVFQNYINNDFFFDSAEVYGIDENALFNRLISYRLLQSRLRERVSPTKAPERE